MTTFDFLDGNGPVPAHQHMYSDGSIGGWIADSAWVSGDAWVSGNALRTGISRCDIGLQIRSSHHRVYRVAGKRLAHDLSKRWQAKRLFARGDT